MFTYYSKDTTKISLYHEMSCISFLGATDLASNNYKDDEAAMKMIMMTVSKNKKYVFVFYFYFHKVELVFTL